MKKILFVCTGNTCRSPMAEALAKKLFPELDFVSRGLSVSFSSPVSDFSLSALRAFGIDNFSHYSASLSENDLLQADLVLAMTVSHCRYINTVFPAFSDKVLTLSEFSGNIGIDVLDPFGGSQAVYNACCNQLYTMLKNCNFRSDFS